MAQDTDKPKLMTPDLEKLIEKIHFKKMAEAEERARIAAVLREVWGSLGGRAFQRFIETRPAETTRKVYQQHLEDYMLWLARAGGGIDPLDATPEDLARYEQDVNNRVSRFTKRRLSLRTRQERIRTVRTAYQFCTDEELVDRSPARHLRIRGRAEPKRTFLTDDQALALLRACDGTRLSDVRDRTLITVLLHTGLRAAEVANLRWGDLAEGDPPTITVEGKGRVVRTVPISRAAHRAIRAWGDTAQATRGSEDPIWTRVTHRIAGDTTRASETGTWSVTDDRLTPSSIHALVTRRAKRAGVKDATPHTLRRTYATKLKRLGVSIDTISRYLGHASIMTTVNYFSPYDEEATQTVKALDYGQS